MKKSNKSYRVVLGDYGSEEEIGIVSIDKLRRRHICKRHWITLSNGNKRGWYNYREISESDFDVLKTFESLPELKVSYRPISKNVCSYMFKHEEDLNTIFMISLYGLAITGLILILQLLLGVSNIAWVKTTWGIIFSVCFVIGYTGSFLAIVVQSICWSRYNRGTKHDQEPRRYHEYMTDEE